MTTKKIGKTTQKQDDKPIIDIASETVGTETKIETEQIPLITKQSNDSTIQIDFMSDDETAGFISQPTKAAPTEVETPDAPFSFSGKTVDEVQTQIKTEEADYAKELTVEDFQEVAEFFIDLIDFGVISLARFISKENSDQPFEVSEKKKRKLIKQLTLIAIKHKMKIGIELLFVGTMIMVYAGPIKKAFKMKREKAELEKARIAKEILTPLT